MSKVVKGAIFAGAILLTGGVAAFAAPALFASTAVWGVVTSLATSAFLSGVSAQLQSGKRQRPSMTVEYAGTIEPRRLIYGKVRVSGMHVIPPLTSGNDNKYLHTVLALAGHEVNAIPAVYFNQVAVGTIGSITGASTDGLVSTGDFDDRAWVRRYLGTSSQTADYILNTAFTDWTSDHRGRGVAYVAVQFQLDDEVYKTGRPEVTCDVEGMKCYDPRLDTSPGANPTNASYIAYTTNPALCLANYLCGTGLGLGDDPANIDWEMVEDAADICDELVDVPTAATQARYTLNGVFYATERPEDVIQTMAGAMLGSCLMSGGKWRIRAGAWETESFEITADDVMGPVELETAYPINERWNGVRGSFVDPDNNYQTNEFPPVQDPSYVTEDGESISRDVAFPCTTNVYEAQRLAIYLTRKSRNRMRAVIPCSLKLWKVRPGMTGIVTIPELGWTNYTVRCEGWGFTPDGLVALTVRQESADDWDDPLESDYTEPLAITTPAPAYFTPAAPSGLTTAGETRGIAVKWTAPALMPTGSRYELYMHTASTPFASATKVWEGFTTSTFVERSDYDTVYFWVRAVTADGQAGATEPATTGVAGAADRADTDNIESGAATVVYTDTLSSVGPTGSSSNPLEIAITEAGTFEIAVSSKFVVNTFTGAGNLLMTLTAPSSSGSFVELIWASYPVPTSGTVIFAALKNTYITSGSGPWTIRFGFADDGAGNTFTATQMSMRVTVVRR